MRGVVVLALCAACGRFGFGDSPGDAPHDDARPTDGMADAMPDATAALPGLIGAWSMDDDPSDGQLDDTSGNGHVALCAAGISCPTAIAGKHGMAIHVDGTQFARVTYGAWLGTSGPFTYAAWIYVEQDLDQVAFARPVGTNVADSWDAVTWSVASGNGTCVENADGAGTNQATCGATSPLNQWIHVAASWDGAVAALYMNGVKVGSKATPTISFDTHDLVIGTDENSGSPAYQFHGRIDDLQLYKRALSAAEINGLAR